MSPDSRFDLLKSALSSEGVLSEPEILAWIEARTRAHRYDVRRVPLEGLAGWIVDPATGDVTHQSGKFFTVTGLEIETNARGRPGWSQPILLQPEVGILGFIAKRLGGVLHLLVQAKMEPGNANLVQISPTVQATRSNFTRVHGGRLPAYVEYFIEGRGVVLADQLQSEQGARYLRKRNRNVIIRVADDEVLDHGEDFVWVTVGQLVRLTRHQNLVHLDCRSILGSLCLPPHGWAEPPAPSPASSFAEEVLRSLWARDGESEHTLAAVLGWVARLRIEQEVVTRRVALKDVPGWSLREGTLQHDSGRFFSVLGVEVSAPSREVAGWSQPLVRSVEGGILGLIAQRRGDFLHFLIQARMEPGFMDTVELAPTVQYAPVNYEGAGRTERPAFADLFEGQPVGTLRVDTVLSDEGGRFYHSQQRHMVLELDAATELDVSAQYEWMTLGQIQACARFSNMLNVELRSVLSCLPLS